MAKGFEAALGMGIALLIGSIPAAIAHSYYEQRGTGVEHDISNFMRDLTEARKTGASPENCMENLSGRNYGRFTPILETATRQIRWGLSFGVIYKTFKEKIKSWLALINIYLLVDAIEVGGGTPETLETLTHFSETLSSLEKEKKQSLAPTTSHALHRRGYSVIHDHSISRLQRDHPPILQLPIHSIRNSGHSDITATDGSNLLHRFSHWENRFRQNISRFQTLRNPHVSRPDTAANRRSINSTLQRRLLIK